MAASQRTYENLLWFLPSEEQERCRKELEEGFSVQVKKRGKAYWINPHTFDRPETDQPLSIRIPQPDG